MEFIWMSYILYVCPHMLTDSQPEDSYPKSSHIARFDNI